MKNFQIQYIISASLIVILIIILDQTTKNWAQHNLSLSYPVTFFLSLTLSFNKGISFGLFNNSGTDQVILVLIGLCIILWLVLIANSHTIIPSAFIIGGAIGNIIDRLHVNAVVDFIHLHYSDYHFPIFNVADVAICIGCGILFLLELLYKNQPKSKTT